MLDITYIYILTAIAMFVSLTIVRRSSYFDHRRNKYFIFAIFADIIIQLGYVGRDLSEQLDNMPLAHISNTLIYMFAPMSMFFLTLAAAKKGSKLTYVLSFLEAISVIIALSSPFTHLFYVISPDVVYSRGPLYIYNEILGILFTVLWAICSFIEFKHIEPIDKFYLSEIFVVQLIAIILQGVNSTYKVVYICGSFMMLVYYAFVIEVYGKYDNLTRVRNSLYYHSIALTRAPEKNYSVIMFDANGLKKVNDNFGHDAGDKLICAVASAIAKAVGKFGSVYRTGGDEFIAVLNSADEKRAEEINNSVHRILEENSSQYEFPLSVSSGFAVHSKGEKFVDTVNRADKKMYENKNRYYVENGLDRRRH